MKPVLSHFSCTFGTGWLLQRIDNERIWLFFELDVGISWNETLY